MQARYQKARHYQRVAMGKATAMDVSATETLTEAHRGLYAIVALVVGAQAWQVYLGGSLLHFLFTRLRVMDHVRGGREGGRREEGGLLLLRHS